MILNGLSDSRVIAKYVEICYAVHVRPQETEETPADVKTVKRNHGKSKVTIDKVI